MAMFTAQQAVPNIPYVYKGIYFTVVCASVLLLFVIGQIFDIPGVNFK